MQKYFDTCRIDIIIGTCALFVLVVVSQIINNQSLKPFFGCVCWHRNITFIFYFVNHFSFVFV